MNTDILAGARLISLMPLTLVPGSVKALLCVNRVLPWACMRSHQILAWGQSWDALLPHQMGICVSTPPRCTVACARRPLTWRVFGRWR